MLRFSLSNLVAAATIIDETTEDATYVVDNVKTPQRPFKPWKTTSVATDQSFVVDFGGTTTIEAIGLIRTNFTTVVIQGNSVNVWSGTPPYTHTITIARNPWNTRYQYGYLPVAFAYRYLRVAISPPQARTDGASVYKLGGLWAGALTTAPRDFAETYTLNRIEPRMDVAPASRAWSQRLTMGEPRVALRLKLDVVTGTPPGKTDLLAAWLEMQRKMTDAQYFLALVEDDDPAQSYIVQPITEPDWQIGTGSISTQASFELQEMLGAMIVDAGKNSGVQRLIDAGATIAVFNYVAIGTDGTTPTASDTALGAEIGTRVQDADATPDPPSPAGSQAIVVVFPAGNGTGTIREVGLFNASVGGTMLWRKVFPAIEKDAGATLTITLTSALS